MTVHSPRIFTSDNALRLFQPPSQQREHRRRPRERRGDARLSRHGKPNPSGADRQGGSCVLADRCEDFFSYQHDAAESGDTTSEPQPERYDLASQLQQLCASLGPDLDTAALATQLKAATRTARGYEDALAAFDTLEVQRNVAVVDRARFAAHANMEVEARVRAEQRVAYYRRLVQSREENATTVLFTFVIGALLGAAGWKVMLWAIALAGGALFSVILVHAGRKYKTSEEA